MRSAKKGGVAAVVDIYRALPGVMASPKDGPIIAGLVGRYGADSIIRAMEQKSLRIGAAENPLLFLVGIMEKFGGNGQPPVRREGEAERSEPSEQAVELTAEERSANLRRVAQMMAETTEAIGRKRR